MSTSIVSLGDYAFEGCSNLSFIDVTHVNSLGEYVFLNSGLKAIELYNIDTVPSGCFFSCEELTNVVLPNTLTKIESGAFSECTKLTSLKIPEGVTSIEGSAFNTTGFVTVGLADSGMGLELPNSLTNIGQLAFFQCADLTTVILPNNVVTVGTQAFSQCDKLTHFRFSNSMTATGEGIFSMNEAILSVGPVGSGAGIEITDSIKTISKSAFSSCTALISVDLPNTVTTIQDFAFQKCSSLTSAKLHGVITLGQAFSNCGKIESLGGIDSGAAVEISGNLKTLGNESFSYTGLRTIYLPEGVTNINYQAFRGCSLLTEVYLPSTIKKIGQNAFYYSSMADIYFAGTTTQWNSVSLHSTWRSSTKIKNIICSDGTVTY